MPAGRPAATAASPAWPPPPEMPKPPKQPARNPFDPFDGTVVATLDVHVITGKGRNSGVKGPVLPGRVRAALKGSVHVDAHTQDAGGGGFLVRLKV